MHLFQPQYTDIFFIFHQAEIKKKISTSLLFQALYAIKYPIYNMKKVGIFLNIKAYSRCIKGWIKTYTKRTG